MQGSPFYFGVVEDARNDSLMLGRCRVRVVGVHTENKRDLPTDMLPWALPLQPITSAGISGIGTAPVGVVEGAWVMVTFIDSAFQQPIMMGTIGGYNEDVPFDFDNQETVNQRPAFIQSLSDVPAESGDTKANSGGMAQCVSPAVLAAQLPENGNSAKEVFTAFESVKLNPDSTLSLELALGEINTIKDDALSSFASAQKSAESLATSVAAAGTGLLSSISTTSASADSLIQKQLANASASVNSKITGVSGSIASAATSLADDITNSAKAAVDSFTSKAFGLVSSIEKSISDMIGQIETQFAELKSMSDSINVDKLMADIKEVTSQAGDKAAAGIENATTLISAGLMKLEDLKTDAEKTEVLSMLQDKLADLDSTVREEILSSSNDIMKQFALIKELGENGSSMLADKVEEAKNICAGE